MTMSAFSWVKKVVATAIVAADGSGDFTDIQTAINSLPAGGGVVYIKEGIYPISAALNWTSKDNVALIGAGKATQISVVTSIYILDITTSDGIFISQLYFKGVTGPAFARPAVFFDTCTNSIISHCWIEDAGDTGISIDGGSRITIIANHSITCDEAGIKVDGTDECLVANNTCSNNNGDGILLVDVDHCIVDGNISTGNAESGIEIGGASNNNIITSNVCINNTVEQITDGGIDTQLGHNVTT